MVSCVSTIKKIPGDFVIDFTFFGDDKVIILSNNGYLSCFKLIHNICEILTVKRIYFHELERASSLVASPVFNKICVSTIISDDRKLLINSSGQLGKSGPSRPNKPVKNNSESFKEGSVVQMTNTSTIKLYFFEYDFIDNFFALKFDKSFRTLTRTEERWFDVQMRLSGCRNGVSSSVLFLSLNKVNSDCLCFLLKDYDLVNFSHFKLKDRCSWYQFSAVEDGEATQLGLWMLGGGGNVRIFV